MYLSSDYKNNNVQMMLSFQTNLGRVTFQIDKIVSEGTYSGEFSLSQDGNNKDNTSRTLDLEIVWSNRISDEAS